MKKTWFIIIGIVVIAALGVGVYFAMSGGDGAANKLLKDAVSPVSGPIDDKVSETGIIATNVTYNVSTTVPGKVVTCNIEEGGSVNQGDVMYVIDATDLRNQIKQAETAVEKARTAYNQSTKAKADLSIVTTGGGSISKLYIHTGDYINVGTKVADIVNNDTVLLKVPFNTAQKDSINVGDSAKVQITKSGAQVWGNVHEIYDYSEGQSGSGAAVFVEISVKNPGAIMVKDKAVAIVNGVASMGEGEFENLSEYSVYAKQTGTIQSINFEEGKYVPSGSVLATIKNDAIDNAIETASLQVTDAQNAVSQLKDKLNDYTITAPVSATVEKLNVKQSEIATAQAPLAVLSDRDAICAEVEIDELYISKVKTGQRADVFVDALDKMKYAGTVTSVDETGIAKNGVTYYKVKIALDNIQNLRIGMNLTIDIITGHKEHAITLPGAYVKNGKVSVIKGDKVEDVDVTTGIKTDDSIEILSGVSVDDKVVLPAK